MTFEVLGRIAADFLAIFNTQSRNIFMKHLVFILYFLYALTAFATDKGVAHHPTPKDPIFLSVDLYDSLKKQLPLPPKEKSSEQIEDEKILHELQLARTAVECKMANAEVYVSLASFYGSPQSSLNELEVKKWTTFFEQVRNDADFFIQKMKKDLPRPRPFAYLKRIDPCVPKEVTGAYPSGHATLALLYARILGEIKPTQKVDFESRSLQIGKHRVLSGMHHPTDVTAGRALADLLFLELKKSKKFNESLKGLQVAL